MTPVIETSALVKTFGPTTALNQLDLTVSPGEVHGFLGPNGAGKSTTIRILLGLLQSDSGYVEVLGQHPWHDAVNLHRRMAYVPGDVELWPELTGGEAIDLLMRLRGSENLSRRDELIDRFDLDPTKKGRSYSKGNRQKVALVAALASDAELLLLDEPTAGLDPLMEVVFRDVIRQIKAEGRTVLLSSHILSQVEDLAERVSIIRLGTIVQTGTLDEMRMLTSTTVQVETARPVVDLDRMSGVSNLEVNGSKLQFLVASEHLDAALKHVGSYGLTSLVSHPPTLEELMLRHYGDGEVPMEGAS